MERKWAFERLGYHTHVYELAKTTSNDQTLCDDQVANTNKMGIGKWRWYEVPKISGADVRIETHKGVMMLRYANPVICQGRN